jgi:hypothetical protein
MKIKSALLAVLLLSCLWTPRLIAGSGVDVNINLPLVQIKSEPEMAVIQGTNIYYIIGYEQDYFFYGGYWWRTHDNRWYRAHHYNGKWKYRKNMYVPASFKKLPPDWRKKNTTHSGIKYQDMKKNWKKWDKEKHWDKKQDKENSGRGRK